MSWCTHPNLQSTARRDFCPECKYEFYYGDAHAQGDAQISKVINAGRDARANGDPPRDSYYDSESYYDDHESSFHNYDDDVY